GPRLSRVQPANRPPAARPGGLVQLHVALDRIGQVRAKWRVFELIARNLLFRGERELPITLEAEQVHRTLHPGPPQLRPIESVSAPQLLELLPKPPQLSPLERLAICCFQLTRCPAHTRRSRTCEMCSSVAR